jgi:hypothetical protein
MTLKITIVLDESQTTTQIVLKGMADSYFLGTIQSILEMKPKLIFLEMGE